MSSKKRSVQFQVSATSVLRWGRKWSPRPCARPAPPCAAPSQADGVLRHCSQASPCVSHNHGLCHFVGELCFKDDARTYARTHARTHACTQARPGRSAYVCDLEGGNGPPSVSHSLLPVLFFPSGFNVALAWTRPTAHFTLLRRGGTPAAFFSAFPTNQRLESTHPQEELDVDSQSPRHLGRSGPPSPCHAHTHLFSPIKHKVSEVRAGVGAQRNQTLTGQLQRATPPHTPRTGCTTWKRFAGLT